MTEDQIKAIAEEFAKSKFIMFHLSTMYNKKFAERVLNFLNDRYCIVEREKVMEIVRDIEASSGYVEIPKLNERIKVVTLDTLNRISIDLFGNSMFNQNEE